MRRLSVLLALGLIGGLVWAGVGYRPAAVGIQTAKPAASAMPQPPPPPPKQVTICAVGDVMLDRNVDKAIRVNGLSSIMERVADRLKAADITFANLECPLSSVGPHSPTEHLVFRARPETVKVLTQGGVDIVSLANNHTLNAGREGILQTFEHLKTAGIAFCGAAEDRQAAGDAVYVTANDVTVGFVAYTDLSFEHGSYAKVGEDYANILAAVARARKHSDIVAVSLHWGEEYQQRPTERQKRLARALVDGGADVVLGHHPHTLQGIEIYKGRPILYSMGNFVFDQRDAPDGRMESAIFELRWHESGGWSVRLTPVYIPRSRMGPVYPGASKRDAILARMARLSDALGAQVVVRDGQGYVMASQQAPKPAAAASATGAG